MELYPSENQGIKCSITIAEDLIDKVYIHRQSLPVNHPALCRLPKRCNSYDSVMFLLQTLTLMKVCVGNPDTRFSKTFVGKCEGDFGALNGQFQYSSTIHSRDCEPLIDGFRCKMCMTYCGTEK